MFRLILLSREGCLSRLQELIRVNFTYFQKCVLGVEGGGGGGRELFPAYSWTQIVNVGMYLHYQAALKPIYLAIYAWQYDLSTTCSFGYGNLVIGEKYIF